MSGVLLESIKSLVPNAWPSRSSETWKYSSAKKFLEREWNLSDASFTAATLLSGSNIAFANELSSWASVVLIAGNEFRSFDSKTPGVKITSVGTRASAVVTPANAAAASPLSSGLSGDENPILRLNEGLSQQTIQIDVEGEVERPLALMIATVDSCAIATRVIFNFHPGSKVELLEWVGSTSEITSGLINATFEYNVHAGAQVNCVRLENADAQAFVLSHSSANIASDAKFSCWQVDVGHAWSRQEWTAFLQGENAHADLRGIMHAGVGRHVDHQTYIHHTVGHTTSKQIYKSVLNEHSRAVFNGKIVIPKNAQKSNSEMLNKNLMLSRKCEVDAKPELLVSANDVKASHGCTMGQLNDDELFYLATRCIDPEHARLMLAKGFATDIVHSIPHPRIRELALGQLEKSLAGIAQNMTSRVVS